MLRTGIETIICLSPNFLYVYVYVYVYEMAAGLDETSFFNRKKIVFLGFNLQMPDT